MATQQVNDLVEVLKQLQDRSAEQAANKALMNQLSQTIGDLLEHLETFGPAVTKAVADALAGSLRGLRVEANPQVSLQMPKRQQCRIEFDYEGNRLVGATVTHEEE